MLVLDGFGAEKSEAKGVLVRTLSAQDAEKLGLEFMRTDSNYQAYLERVSAEAKARNYAEAEIRLAQLREKNRNGFSLQSMLYKMGRDPSHFSSGLVDEASPMCHEAKVGAAGSKALDIFYNWHSYKTGLVNNLDSRIAEYWIGQMENRQAVTNRKNIVVLELVKAIESVSENEVVRIFSLAGGDAQVIIEAIKKSKRDVSVMLVDPDREALNAAKRNAKEAGLEDSFVVKRGIASAARKFAVDFKPHIFDVVGLMDYLDDEKVIEVVSLARESLSDKGVLITGNIIDNNERVFLEDVLLWFMIYREPGDFGSLVLAGGFPAEKVQIICEPFRIHAIAICQK